MKKNTFLFLIMFSAFCFSYNSQSHFYSIDNLSLSDPIKFSISPNPSSKFLNIELSSKSSSSDFIIEVYDVLGKQIYKGQFNKLKTSINVHNWRQGVYLVKLTNEEFTETKRFIKQ